MKDMATAITRLRFTQNTDSESQQPQEGAVVRAAGAECGRYQTLARLAQRSLGVKPQSAPSVKTKGKRRRKPVVRALKAATAMKPDEPSS